MMTTVSEEAALKRLRKGTKSCTECRQRKVRCIFKNVTDHVCRQCAARGRTCIPQIYQRRRDPATTTALTSRDRISRLEKQLATINATVGAGKGNALKGDVNHNDDDDDQNENENASESDEARGGKDPQGLEKPGANPPTHLSLLFDNALIGPDSQRRRQETHGGELPSIRTARCSERYLAQARSRLQRLVPTRGDVAHIAEYAAPWMFLYHGFFPALSFVGDSIKLLSNYDTFMAVDAHPVAVAAFLVTLAITVRQLSNQEVQRDLQSLRNIPRFVREVVNAVQATVIASNELAATTEGIETIVLYLRLQLGRGAIRDLWLTLRRTIALAELIGLQRLPYATLMQSGSYRVDRNVFLPSNQTEDNRIALLEAICATDRMAAMMFNLPAATMSYKFPPKQLVDKDGSISPQSYMFELASIAMHIQDCDEGFALGEPDGDIYEKVLIADRNLRALAARTPRSWWTEPNGQVKPEHLVQFFHCYLTVRMHLHSAMTFNEHDQYAYSRNTCLDACHNTSRRYLNLRRLLPAGFFVTRLTQMQIFTVATVLMLSHYRDVRSSVDAGVTCAADERMSLVMQVIAGLEADSTQVGAEFAVEAVAALRSLRSLLENPEAHSSTSLTLRIPMLGKVLIGRKHQQISAAASSGPSVVVGGGASTNSRRPGQSEPLQAEHQAQSWSSSSTSSQTYANPPQADDFSWLLELDKTATFEDPFLATGFGDFEQWLHTGDELPDEFSSMPPGIYG